jgi:formylglycine-generating enzyme required for sulfatase activity
MARQVLALLVLAILLGACGSFTATQEPTLISERTARSSGEGSSAPAPAATPTRPPPTETLAPAWRPWSWSAGAPEGAATDLQNDSGLLPAASDGDRTPVIEALDGEQADMVYVPEGEFLMGSNTDSAEERPAHTVYLDAFWIDRTEVTYAQFVHYLNRLGGHEGQCSGYDCNEIKDGDKNSHMLYQDGQYVVEAGYEDYPMSEVTWYGAQAYCEWAGKRLPTEAEWEKAARGIDGRRYPWGNSQPNCAKVNFRTCVRSTITVGRYPAGASPCGALDMAGNVYEWTADWYDRDYYQAQAASQPNPTGPVSGRNKVARGGSSYDLDLYLIRTTYRFGYVPETGHRVVGFRCAAQPSVPAGTHMPIDPAAAVAPVAHNDEWVPLVREFDAVPMALVPPGCFLMGSEEGDDNEQPVHEHCFDRPLWIDLTEVTNVQYGSEGHFSGIDRPRDTVDWFEAAAHCRSRGARLPTEAEWEYAARGPDGLSYPWGTVFAAHNVFFADNSLEQSWDVGLRPAAASWVGALNMSGNLWEWVSSLLKSYPYDSADGREVDGVANQGQRVLRGGSWESDAALLRTTVRYSDDPHAALPDRGFRCVRTYEP